MNTEDVKAGDIITNGQSAMRAIARVAKDRHWGTSGIKGENVALEEFGGNLGMSSFIPDYLLSSWRPVPFEWTATTGNLEERYVSANGWLQREVRKVAGNA